MRELDIYPARDFNLILDGELHRYAIEGDSHSSKNGAYCIFTDGVPAGYIQNWKSGIKENWRFNTGNFPKEQRDYFNSREYREATERKRIEREKAQKEKQLKASEMARTMFEQLEAEPYGHPYLKKKDVEPYDLKLNNASNALAVPLRDINRKFLSLQWIDAEGNKKFFTDAPTKGAFWSIALDTIEKHNTILLGEGYATMAKIYELTQLPCVAAMNCHNLVEIAQILQNKYPNAKIIIAADDDRETEQKRGFNPGKTAADNAVKLGYAKTFLTPPFENDDIGTDWDDFSLIHGDKETKLILEKKLYWGLMSDEEKQEIIIRSKLRETIHMLDPSVQLPPQEFIGGLFPRKFISLLAAPPGTGKTIFMQKSVSDLSVGGSFFDGFSEDEPPRTCLIFAGEAGYELLVRRGAHMKWKINPEKVLVVDQHEFDYKDMPIMLDNDEGWENVKKLVDMYKPDIVFWDTFSSFHEKDENKASEMKPVIKKIARLANEKNLAAILVHHSRKRAASERNLSLNQDDVIGSSIVNRLVALIIGIEPMKDDEKTLLVKPLKTWFSSFMPFTYKLTEGIYGGTTIETNLAPAVIGSPRLAVWRYLTENFKKGEWFAAPQIILSQVEENMQKRKLTRILEAFVKEGKLTRRGAKKSLEYCIS